jgi:hypothetical protein
LRRSTALVTDPAIHDFIGLSENFWDFNSADGMAGMRSPTLNHAGRLLTGVAEPPSERFKPKRQ